MAALTLLEAAKLMPAGTPKAYIEVYASTYQPMAVMPLQPRPNGQQSWVIEYALDSNVGSRQVGSDFTAGSGQVKPFNASTKAYGGKIQVDRKIQKEQPESVADHKILQIKALARKFTVDLFQGAAGASMVGLRTWVRSEVSYAGQNFTTGATSGGSLPTMLNMDTLLSKVNRIPGKTFIYSNLNPFMYMASLARTNGTGQQNIVWAPNQFGIQVPMYQGYEWIVLQDGAGVDLLDNVETETGITTGTATSIYAVTWAEELTTGFQSGAAEAEEAVDATNFKTGRIDWNVGLSPKAIRGFARLANVKNATA